jgi:alkyl hydroperoxide reductase subunit D
MPELATPNLDALKDTLPDPARDVKLTLGTVLASETLTAAQAWGVALASAFYLREPRLRDAVLADAKAAGVDEAVFEDARAAASIMGMNTVYYRFRHMVGKESYAHKPARLRMTWMARPKTSKGDYELMSMAVAALAGCEMCVRSHEGSILQSGLTEEHVHDTVRLAAVLYGLAVAVNLA